MVPGGLYIQGVRMRKPIYLHALREDKGYGLLCVQWRAAAGRSSEIEECGAVRCSAVQRTAVQSRAVERRASVLLHFTAAKASTARRCLHCEDNRRPFAFTKTYTVGTLKDYLPLRSS